MVPGLSVAAASDVGLVRSQNEDSYVAGHHLWAVADGMGGQAAGRMASQIAIRHLVAADADGLDQARVAGLFDEINQDILGYGRSHPAAAGLGTTLAGIALVALAGQAHWLVFNIGDSRVYRLTGGRLHRETNDHSETQALVDMGTITAAQARTHPSRNVLTRCLGAPQKPRADMRLVPYLPGDRLMICSDGLTSEVDDATIERVLLTAPNPDDAATRLIATALQLGGRDNVTVVVIGIGGAEGDSNGGLVEDTLPTAVVEGSYAIAQS